MYSAHIMTTVTIRDAEAFARYRDAVATVNAGFDAPIVVRQKVAEVLSGEAREGDIVVILGFATERAARAYIGSPAYRALAPLREAAGDFTIRLLA